MTQEISASQGALAEADAWGALAPPRPAAANNDPLAGYALWLNPTYRAGTAFQDTARTIPAAVGDPVGGLYDATNAITASATGSARPMLGATGLTLNGTSNYMDAAIGARPQPETIYIVVAPTAANGHVHDSVSALWRPRCLVNSTTLFDVYDGSNAVFTTTAGTLVSAVVVVVFNGASSVLSHTSAAGTASNTGTITGTGTGLRIGGGGGASVTGFLKGEIREILVYRAAHDAATRASEIAKAAARCGVTL
jgi:hypothetical protein